MRGPRRHARIARTHTRPHARRAAPCPSRTPSSSSPRTSARASSPRPRLRAASAPPAPSRGPAASAAAKRTRSARPPCGASRPPCWRRSRASSGQSCSTGARARAWQCGVGAVLEEGGGGRPPRLQACWPWCEGVSVCVCVAPGGGGDVALCVLCWGDTCGGSKGQGAEAGQRGGRRGAEGRPPWGVGQRASGSVAPAPLRRSLQRLAASLPACACGCHAMAGHRYRCLLTGRPNSTPPHLKKPTALLNSSVLPAWWCCCLALQGLTRRSCSGGWVGARWSTSPA